jgi:Spy/CpxP family protein refolding chaperone
MKIAFALIIGIFLGIAGTGIFIHHRFQEARHHQGNFNPFLDKLTTKLSLSSTQRDSIKSILTDFQSQLETARQDTNLKLKTMRDSYNDKIRSILNPDQKQKFNEIVSQWEAKHNNSKGWNVPGAMPPSLGALVPGIPCPPTPPSGGKP